MTGLLAGAFGLLVGLVIGTLGGGGGVLAVPALVFALGQDARSATTGSLLIVGVVSAVGLLSRLHERSIDWRTGTFFGIIGVPTAWVGSIANRVVPQPTLLLSFALLAIVLAVLMLVKRRPDGELDAMSTAEGTRTISEESEGSAVRIWQFVTRAGNSRWARILGIGGSVGFLTGFLGVGGGFLVVPALTIVLGMGMPTAVATSLLVLCYNTISSMVARLGELSFDWSVIGPFVGSAVIAALSGRTIAGRLPAVLLQRSFAVLLILVGVFVGSQSVIAFL